jgi:hypothetical protein
MNKKSNNSTSRQELIQISNRDLEDKIKAMKEQIRQYHGEDSDEEDGQGAGMSSSDEHAGSDEAHFYDEGVPAKAPVH